MKRRRSEVTRAWLVGALSITLALACSRPPAADPAPKITAERIAPPIVEADHLRAHAHAEDALRTLADARRRLFAGDAAEVAPLLEEALSEVREARSLLPPEVVILTPARGEPLRLTRPRDRVVLPLSALAATGLSPSRIAARKDARSVAVDLGELERGLARALSRPTENLLAEISRIVARSVTFADEGDARFVDGDPEDGAQPSSKS